MTGQVTVTLVDPDGRLGDVADALADERTDLQRVDSHTAVSGGSDCVVVLDAPAGDSHEAVDGPAIVRDLGDRVDVPVVVYTLREGHDPIDASLAAGAADVIRVPPHREDLLRRRVRYAAGVSPDAGFQSAAEQLTSLLRNYPHTLFIKDEVGRFANMTTHTAGNYGFVREQLVGMSDYELFDPEHADALFEEEQDIMATGRPMLSKIEEYVDETGTRRWSSTTKVPRYDESGNIIGIVGGTRDVTAAKRQEEMMAALHDASRELSRAQTKREIADVTGSMTTDISLFTGVRVVLRRDDRLQTVTDTGPIPLFEGQDAAFERAYETGTTQYVDSAGVVTDDQSAVVESTRVGRAFDEEVGMVVPLGDHGAIGLGIDDGVFDDFTNRLGHVLASNVVAALDRAERERELARKNRQLEEFATLGAHELRNRLQITLSAVVREQAERESDRLANAEQTLGRMDRLLNQLLRLARTGEIPRTKESVDLRRTAERAWEGVEGEHVTLEGPPSAVLSANPDALTELFEFLFRNAEEHAGEGVTVSVGCLEDGFYVEDDGVGIADELKSELFEVSYANAADNTGYGLYIVSAIVEAHDWEIAVGDSDSGGARFEVTGVTWQ